MALLQVHAANKPIDRSNNDAVLRRVAELAVGYSGAELANLLNEGAILAVSTPPHPGYALFGEACPQGLGLLIRALVKLCY